MTGTPRGASSAATEMPSIIPLRPMSISARSGKCLYDFSQRFLGGMNGADDLPAGILQNVSETQRGQRIVLTDQDAQTSGGGWLQWRVGG